MVAILTSILGPIVYPMGVSEADLIGYLTMLQGYIAAILALFVVMIVVLIVAHWAKKGFKHVVRWTAVMAWLLAVVVIADMICYGPMKQTLQSYLNASKIELNEETVSGSRDAIQKVAEEGLVLVKNTGLLPLSSDVTAVNVFGWDSTNPLYGGTGSGTSDSSTAVSILQGLQDAGYATNTELSDMYVNYRADRPTIAMAAQDWTLPEPTVDYYTDSLMSNAKSFSDVAIVVIGRSGGEGADLPTDMNAVIHNKWNIANQVSTAPNNYGYFNGTYTNNGDYDDFDEGESYLELSNTEEAMIEKVCANFDKVIVVINANNAMELGWVDNYEQIGAVILAPGEGATGFEALGEIISGTINPSGKTVDTYVKDLTKTPYYNNINNFSYTNVDDFRQEETLDSAYPGNVAFVNYVEGIYVGYKFYETAAEEGLINYDDYVQYPFGYGLSYTTFEQKISAFDEVDGTIVVEVTVTNTGSVAGKDVVEVYYNPPYTNGGIEKASANLVQFGKTSLLEPGASETVVINFSVEDMASYDYTGIKAAAGSGYVLEAGDYVISIRSDSHTILDSKTYTVASDIDYSEAGRSTDKVAATNQFEDYSKGTYEVLSRKDGFANYATATAAPSDEAYILSDEGIASIKQASSVYFSSEGMDNADDVMPTMGANNGLKLADLAGKDYDDPMWDQLLDQLSYADMVTMTTYAGWSTAAVDSVGKIATSDCDGPAGLSNFMTGNYGTAFPAEVLMASTWNTDLIGKMGEALGTEYADANNYGWYGPAMNTHRSAFAGRNFEYFSEDGVLAGYIGAAEVNGAATKGVYAYIKHFVLNDQEDNRCTFLLTYADEQSIREIYLKPFELVVKNFRYTALAVMSSFNFIGTKPACANTNSLKNVLRDEWGFQGMVLTDYDGSYGYMVQENVIRNYGDIMLGFGNASNPAGPNLMPKSSGNEADASATLVLAMRRACHDIMYTIGNSGYYVSDITATSEEAEVVTAQNTGLSNMDKMFLYINIGACAAIIIILLIVWIGYAVNKKNGKYAEA